MIEAIVLYDPSTGGIRGAMTNQPLDLVEDQATRNGMSVLVAEVENLSDLRVKRIDDGKVVDDATLASAVNKQVGLQIKVGLLNDTDWMCRRQEDQLRQGRATSLTEQQYDELLDYRQDLRDWPTSGVFSEPFPTKPSWLV